MILLTIKPDFKKSSKAQFKKFKNLFSFSSNKGEKYETVDLPDHSLPASAYFDDSYAQKHLVALNKRSIEGKSYDCYSHPEEDIGKVADMTKGKRIFVFYTHPDDKDPGVLKEHQTARICLRHL